MLLTFLTQLVHSLGFVKHAPTSGSGVAGPVKAVAGAAIVLGGASAAGSLAPRAVPYVTRVIAPMSKGPLQQAGTAAGTASSRLISSGPWAKKF